MDVDHIFSFVPDPVAAIRQVEAAGLVCTHSRRHDGQGTENRCYGFDNAYLELIWCVDRHEISSAAVARTGLDGRSRWPQTGACPFGACLRSEHPPIPTWAYEAPFPRGMHTDMASTSDQIEEPALFFFPPPTVPPPPGRQALGRRITNIEFAFRLPESRTAALRTLGDVGQITLRHADHPRLTLTLDNGATGRRIDLPEANLVLRL